MQTNTWRLPNSCGQLIATYSLKEKIQKNKILNYYIVCWLLIDPPLIMTSFYLFVKPDVF